MSQDTGTNRTTEVLAREVADRFDVAEVLSRYAQGLDTRDFELVRACFTGDAVIAYSSLPAFPGGFPAFLEHTRATVLQLASTQHLIGNHIITVDGDSAPCNSSVLASRYAASNDNWTTAGRYDDVLARTPDGWRIPRRRFTSHWTSDPQGLRERVHSAVENGA